MWTVEIELTRVELTSREDVEGVSLEQGKQGDPAGGNNDENRFSLFIIACAMQWIGNFFLLF